MSIWASWESIGRRGRGPRRGEVRSYALGWSNHFPDRKVERVAEVGIAHIPAWCVPGHRDEEYSDDFGPWLRLSLDSWEHDYRHPRIQPTKQASLDVVMDETAVRALIADLTAWLDRPKARP